MRAERSVIRSVLVRVFTGLLHPPRRDVQNNAIGENLLIGGVGGGIEVKCADAISQGLVAIRSALKQTSMNGVLRSEAESLIHSVRSVKVSGDMDFIAMLNHLFTQYQQLWGARITAELCERGTLNTLMPLAVRRLSPDKQSSTIKFFNDLLHAYAQYGDKAPASVKRALRETSSNLSVCADKPQYDLFGAFEGNSSAAGDRNLEHIQDGLTSHSSQKMITVPDDLYLAVQSGLMLVHWRPYMQFMNGGWRRMSPQSVGSINEVGVDDLDAADDDQPSDLMPVTRVDPRDANAPAARNTRVRFNADASARRFENATEKSASTVTADLDKMQAGLDNVRARVEAGFTKIMASLESHVENQKRLSEARDAKIADEQSHNFRTVQKLLVNLANNATDLRHADKIHDASAQIGAAARAKELAPAASAAAVASSTHRTSRSNPTLSVVSAADPAVSGHLMAAQASRAASQDSEGFKLSHLPPNDFDKFSDEIKTMYLSRDGVRDKATFISRIAERSCQNCPRDIFSMPHREKHCPGTYGSQPAPEVVAQVGKTRAAQLQLRSQQLASRVLQQQAPVGNKFQNLVAAAVALDIADGAMGSHDGHAAACIAMAQRTGGVDVNDDADAFCMACESYAEIREYDSNVSTNDYDTATARA